jgi:Zn-finger nucleic acid-binding protein
MPAMPCPHCAIPLVMSERQGVEIDYCPQCRGVWLDRGELDKILERASADSAPPPRTAPQAPPSYADRGAHYDQGHGHHRPHHKRRKSWLEEIFD